MSSNSLIQPEKKLKPLDTLGRFSIISPKGDNLSNFLFVLLHAKLLLKTSLLLKERICSLWKLSPF